MEEEVVPYRVHMEEMTLQQLPELYKTRTSTKILMVVTKKRISKFSLPF